MTSINLEKRELQGLPYGVSRYTPDNLNEDVKPEFSTESSLSRRAFLRLCLIAGLGAVADKAGLKIGLDRLEATPATIPPEFTQFDVPSDLKLIRINPGDTIGGLVHGSDIQPKYVMTMNGIRDPRTLRSDEAIVVPKTLSVGNNREVRSFGDLAPFQPVIARAVPNLEVAPKDDFENWELQAFNEFARDASLQLPVLLGMGGANNAGFFRIVRPSRGETDVMLGLSASGMVAFSDAVVCSSNFRAEEEGIVKVSTSCGSNGLFSIYLLTKFSDPAFQYWEKEKPGFGKMKYLDYTEELIRHEMLHLFFGDLEIPPFDTHELIRRLSGFGLTMESDKGFLSGSGFRAGESFYYRDTIEWYLVRQFPDLMAKLFPWAQRKRAEKISITEKDVLLRLQNVQPDFFSWELAYKSPLRINALPVEGKRLVWGTSQGDPKVYWYAPAWNVRWPNFDEKTDGWIDDFHQAPRRVHGTTLYRSWKFLGKSKLGEVPEQAKTASAVAFQNPFDPSGQMANPSESWVKPAAWWR